MDIRKILALLREEREAIDAAILTLERLEHGRRHGPGRPPGLMTKSATNGTNRSYSLPSPGQGEN
jgi:hypothetical protein